MDSAISAAVIGSLVAVLGIIIKTKMDNKYNLRILDVSQRMSQQRKDEIKIENLKEKKQTLLKKLNNFYYPLSRYLDRSKNLSALFKENKPANFRTLLYLLDINQSYENFGQIKLSKNDKVLLDMIFSIGSEIEKLIISNYGIIDDPEFIDTYEPINEFSTVEAVNRFSLLCLAQTHIRIIRKAYNNELTGNLSEYTSYVYPRELNSKVEKKIDDLKKQISDCNKEISVLIGN